MVSPTIRLAAGVFLSVVLASACGSDADPSGESGDGGVGAGSGAGAGTGSGGSTAVGGSASTGGGASSGSGGAAETVDLCLPTCASAADCDMGAPPFDADNYVCEAGLCRYLGCNDDAECMAVGSQVCRSSAGAQDTCVPTCTTPTDCDLGQVAYDADNYDCVQGGCVYTGCNSDTECMSTGNYVCHDFGVGAFCVTPCTTPADCDLGQLPYDTDNYACVDGVCQYTGCNSDSECMALGAHGCG